MRNLWAILLLAAMPLSAAETAFESFGLLKLPTDYRSQRSTVQKYIQPHETLDLADIRGAGCMMHFWLTFNDVTNTTKLGQDLILRIYPDGSETPTVEMPVAYFFAQFHGLPPGHIDSPYLQVTTNGGFNSYLPIPFSDGLRMTLENRTAESKDIYFQGDWRKFESLEEPLRFRALYRHTDRAEAYGAPWLVGESTGRGYLAGMAMGMRVFDRSDAWFHCGGDLILIDGGTAKPSILGGIGGEDFFGTAYGIQTFSNGPIGSAYYIDRTDEKPPVEPHVIFSAHRFFHPDPVRFDESFHFTFGSLENEISSVLYWYEEAPPADKIVEPDLKWDIAGPFPGGTKETFDRSEFPETSLDFQRIEPANFGDFAYAVEQGAKSVSTKWSRDVESHYGFLDIRPFMRHTLPTNFAMPRNASAYATTTLTSDEEREVDFRIGHDDRLRFWLNGERIYDGETSREFGSHTVSGVLKKGENRVLIKTEATDNFDMRAWVFQFDVLEDRE